MIPGLPSRWQRRLASRRHEAATGWARGRRTGLAVTALLVLGVTGLLLAGPPRSGDEVPGIHGQRRAAPATTTAGDILQPRPGALTKTGPLRVRVRTPAGAPVLGASVLADGIALPTDARGEALLRRTPRELRVLHSDHAPCVYYLADPDVTAGALTVVLHPAGRLRCRVLDEAGKPLGGVQVRVRCGGVAPAVDASWVESLRPTRQGDVVYARTGLTRRDGRVDFRGLALGEHEVTGELPGFAPSDVSVGRGSRDVAVLAVGAGGSERTIVLQRVVSRR